MSDNHLSRPTDTVLRPSRQRVHQPNPDPERLGVFPSPTGGLDIAVVAPHATAVDFCVRVGENNGRMEQRWSLMGPIHGVWHGHIDGLGEGTVYGFRAFGPWDPDGGLYYNPSKLLLDPYGRGLAGTPELSPAIHAHHVDHELYPSTYPLARSNLNSALHMPHSVVVGSHFDIAEHPNIPRDETVVYELHVKGFTKNFPDMPEEFRGTYAGLAHPTAIAHLKKLGITTVELLPVHAKMDEPFLTDRGLTNYWGYNTMSFFSPEPSFATAAAQEAGAQAVIDEFRGMVSILHKNGLEVILDVVYNHTSEGGDGGPTVCWRGLDSLMYYRRMPERPRTMIDDTGCGNTLNFSEQRVVQMTLDSLRYWVEEMGVDGFRFDLATTLARLDTGFTPYHPFLVAAASDPVLRDRKLIVEPWDIGLGGWQTGNFPIPFEEWNDRYRDSVRKFWLTDFQQQAAGRPVSGPNDLATRLSGSADMFWRRNGAERTPNASVNFITAHDGFTMADLTMYDHKHNLANLENNQDGSTNNHSWNHGIEGTSGTSAMIVDVGDSEGLVEDLQFVRERSQRNLMATLLLSTGTPMITSGDEFGRTQYGNNNAYCQDSPISWVDWDMDKSQRKLLAMTEYLLELRNTHPVLRPKNFATGQVLEGDVIPDVSWFARDAKDITSDAWSDPYNRVFQMRRSGFPMGDVDALVVFNGTMNVAEVTLPENRGQQWVEVYDTSWITVKHGGVSGSDSASEEGEVFAPSHTFRMEPQSMMLFLSTKREAPAIEEPPEPEVADESPAPKDKAGSKSSKKEKND